jgi:hypothetical protein
MKTKQLFYFLAAILLVAVVLTPVQPVAAQQALNPPPPSFLSCKKVGTQTICQGERVISYGPDDTGIVCGSGSENFTIFDSGTYRQSVIRYYDRNGNLTRRVIHENFTFGQFSNPLSGAIVPYTQHNVITDDLAVPGDFSSATETNTGENNFTLPGQGAILLSSGRIVTAPDGSIEFRAGPQGFLDYGNGDSSAMAKICAALQ